MIVYQDNLIELRQGHVIPELKELPSESVHCVVTSPPYWGLRDYGLEPQVWDDAGRCEHEWGDNLQPRGQSGWHTFEHKYHSPGSHKTTIGSKMKELEPNKGHGQFCRLCNAWKGSLGLEPTPELYIQHIVQVFREIKRVLRKDGVCFINIGDSYIGYHGNSKVERGAMAPSDKPGYKENMRQSSVGIHGLKNKDLAMIPARVALALQADGWWLRSDIIWSKPNPMPESVTDRPTRSHEYVFLLTKSAKYFYDADAVRETHTGPLHNPGNKPREGIVSLKATDPSNDPDRTWGNPVGRNLRSVWTIPTQSFPQAHFATFPEKLVEPCIKAGTSEKGCCPECGAPWVRVVELKGKIFQGWAARKSNPHKFHDKRENPQEYIMTPIKETIGWNPSCKCQRAGVAQSQRVDCGLRSQGSNPCHPPPYNPIPCTVLDPFAGSCRALIVAKKLGRRGIGIDLKGEYLEMPKKELAQERMEF